MQYNVKKYFKIVKLYKYLSKHIPPLLIMSQVNQFQSINSCPISVCNCNSSAMWTLR